VAYASPSPTGNKPFPTLAEAKELDVRGILWLLDKSRLRERAVCPRSGRLRRKVRYAPMSPGCAGIDRPNGVVIGMRA